MQKKAQSALEFLTTYAWAFLVMIIVIGVIAYFGILKPQRVLPDRCTFNVGFDCQAYSINSNGAFNLRLKNGLGRVVTITGISLSTEASTIGGCALQPPVSPLPYTNWPSGNVTSFGWLTCDFATAGFAKGDKGKVVVKMDYYDARAGLTYATSAEGEIFATVN